MTTLNELDDQARVAVKEFYGEKAMSSHLALLTAEMNALPADSGVFHSHQTNARALLLLGMKAIAIHDVGDALYQVHEGHMRGFQFGDPSGSSSAVHLLLVDEHDRVLEMRLGVSGGVPSQPQINAMIASIQPPA